MVEVLSGSSLTAAACAAGFSDLAHFSHVYRRTFGVKASRLLMGDSEEWSLCSSVIHQTPEGHDCKC